MWNWSTNTVPCSGLELRRGARKIDCGRTIRAPAHCNCVSVSSLNSSYTECEERSRDAGSPSHYRTVSDRLKNSARSPTANAVRRPITRYCHHSWRCLRVCDQWMPHFCVTAANGGRHYPRRYLLQLYFLVILARMAALRAHIRTNLRGRTEWQWPWRW